MKVIPLKTNSLVFKWIIAYVVLQVSIAFVFIFLVRSQNRTLTLEQLNERLKTVAMAMKSEVEQVLLDPTSKSIGKVDGMIDDFQKQTGIRVTITDAEGKVLADSSRDAADLENHLSRSEFVQASMRRIGQSTRKSESVGEEMHYFAIAIDVENRRIGYLRTAYPTRPIQERIGRVTRTYGWQTLLSVFLATVIMLFLGRTMASPLDELLEFAGEVAVGNYERRLSPVSNRGDWAMLGKAFDQMQIELIQRERDLAERNDRLAAVLMSMSEGVVAIDERRRVNMANRAATNLFGVSNPDILGRPIYEVVRNPLVEKCIEDVFNSHQRLTREFETIWPSRRMLAMQFTWLSMPTGESVVMVIHDVTNLRQLETMRRDFVANVSHELKTPLASIKAYSETLRLGAIDDPQNRMRFVQRIEEQANRLNDLILDLIQLARVESGQATFEIEDLNLCTIASQRVQAFQAGAANKNISLTLVAPDPKIMVRGDDEGIATVLDNLISNAVRYTPENGSVTVEVMKSENMGMVRVIDNGLGIAPEHHERIFERFYRVDRARSSDLGGTGLGLSIVKHITMSLGGQVALSSRVGKGTTFTVRFPLA
jgi:two-component system, OmpR family, phosphate regulon sensor histidine kinase PhoR